jgi:signal transduction histidine kinase
MTWLPWVLVALLAVVVIILLTRGGGVRLGRAVERLAREADGAGVSATAHAEDPPEVAKLRAAIARGAGRLSEPGDPDAAIRGLFRYLEEAVLAPLQAARGRPEGGARMDDAMNALEDLAFFAKDRKGEVPGTENLGAIVQAVTREFALDTGVPVKFSAPAEVLAAHVAPEAFKDALYLLLANAGRFGKGSTVEVVAESAGDRVKLFVRDRGPGFTPDALYRAFEPFWTTDRDALGLGLTHARKALAKQDATLTLRNREGGGAEVEILLRRVGGTR